MTPSEKVVEAAAPDASAIRANRDPVWKRVVDWLLEDPAKKAADGPSEREKALAAAEAQAAAERKRYVRGVFHLKRRKPEPEDLVAAEERLEAREEHTARQGEVEGLYGPGARAVPRGREGGPLARLVDRLVGARRVQEQDGAETYLPPSETDWRWKVHQFMRSQSRAMSLARTLTVIGVVFMVTWVTMFAVTGYDLLDGLRPDPEGDDVDEEMLQYGYPFFIVESGSMMHRDTTYGRIGTIDPGDLVVIGKIGDRKDVQTFYGPGDRHVAGEKGDVIVYLPVPTPGSDAPAFPIIHRAMAYIEYRVREVPDPTSITGTRAVGRYTVEEFGIYDASAVTIAELGLYNYKPDRSGFITRGDNERTNTWADQGMGVTAYPVPVERILGRVVTEVPFVGLAKIAITGQDPSLLSPDEAWCGFLAGKAPCDTWQVFIVGVTALIGGPLVWAMLVYSRRAYVRRLDRIVLAQRQEAEADSLERLKREQEDLRARTDGREGLRIHDGTDILTGSIAVGPERPRPVQYAGWGSLARHGGVSVWEAEALRPVGAVSIGYGEDETPAAEAPRDTAEAAVAEDTDMSGPTGEGTGGGRFNALRDKARGLLSRLKRPRSD